MAQYNNGYSSFAKYSDTTEPINLNYDQSQYRNSVLNPLNKELNSPLFRAINGKLSDNTKILVSNLENKIPVKYSDGSGSKPMQVRNTNMLGKFTQRQFTGTGLKHNTNINNLVQVIYNNFLELSRYPSLKHDPQEIRRLLTSPDLIMYTIFNQNNMIAYIIGEVMKLNDTRMVLYVSYLYVSSKYREHGLGTELLNLVIDKASLLNLSNIVLTVDTEDQRVLDFYMKKGFMYDTSLRKYDRYDILSLPINAS